MFYQIVKQECFSFLSVAYSTKDVIYHWRADNPVEMPKDMRLSQFDLLETPFNYTSVNYLKGGKSVQIRRGQTAADDICSVDGGTHKTQLSRNSSILILFISINLKLL